jgi:hypothetical protein
MVCPPLFKQTCVDDQFGKSNGAGGSSWCGSYRPFILEVILEAERKTRKEKKNT